MTPLPTVRVVSGATSSAGRKRARNEDYCVSDDQLGLYLVVDGMGGHAGGDVASEVVARAIHQFVATTGDRDKTWPVEFEPALSYNGNRMKAAVRVANVQLGQRISEDDNLRGMGATMAGALVDGNRAVVSNLGDCRAYLIRGGSIQQLTSDHSWVAEQVRSGLISPQEARHHSLRNVVTRAVSGSEGQVNVDIRELSLEPGDRILVCSDGLHGLLTDEELMEQVNAFPDDPQAACDSLVAIANERGAPDNVTAVLVHVSP
jgi:protein phosphatase